MKVQCDVCSAEAASVFCCADEAALCDACDRRVHRANKLAGKHRRFSLLHPGPSSSSSAAAQKPPLCDICQELRGFLFCKEDRAILCRECDVPVHSANDMTRRHSRFLLTGVRLSSAPLDSAGIPSEEEDVEQEQENSSSACNDGSCSAGDAGAGATTTASASDGSSISEYLTKTLPGWHVEDFLIDDASVGAGSDGLYQGQHGQISGVLQEEAYTPWTGQVLADVADERASWERWVPQMHAEFAGDSKRPRASPSPPCSYW